MAFQFPTWKLFVVTAVVGLLVTLMRPMEVVSAIVTFVTAGSLAGLILLGNQANIGTICRCTLWTLLGAYIGSLLSPSPFFQPPYAFLFCGAMTGWALGVALGIGKRKDRNTSTGMRYSVQTASWRRNVPILGSLLAFELLVATILSPPDGGLWLLRIAVVLAVYHVAAAGALAWWPVRQPLWVFLAILIFGALGVVVAVTCAIESGIVP